jgi:hypothetical protein
MKIYIVRFEDYDRKFVRLAFISAAAASREVQRLNRDEPSEYADCGPEHGWNFTEIELKEA